VIVEVVYLLSFAIALLVLLYAPIRWWRNRQARATTTNWPGAQQALRRIHSRVTKTGKE
jgi:hypothetical protein